MKEKGFTLIELLAVIVILAVIALIATPLVMNTINDAKRGALKDTAYGIIEAAEQYIYSIQIDGKVPEGEIDLLNTDLIKYSHGDFDSGKLYLDASGNVALAISKGTTCIMKKFNEREVTMTESTNCSFRFLDYDFGDEVILGDDSYHVLEKTEEGYRLIKDESIGNMGFYEIYSGNRVFKATSDVELLIYHNIVEGYEYTYYDASDQENSTLYTYLNTEWKESLSYKDKLINDIVLIRSSEYLKADGINTPWLNTGAEFWTMTASGYGVDAAIFINSNGKIVYHRSGLLAGYYWDKLGIRPVITIANLEEAS